MTGTADNQKEPNKAITEGVNNQMKCQRTANGRFATLLEPYYNQRTSVLKHVRSVKEAA